MNLMTPSERDGADRLRRVRLSHQQVTLRPGEMTTVEFSQAAGDKS